MNSDTLRLLFVIIDGGGNVDPQLGVAREAVRRGHQVRVMAHDSLSVRVAAVGATFVSFASAPQSDTRSRETDLVRDWEARTRLGALNLASKRLALDPAAAFAGDVRDELTRQPAEVAVIDCMVPGAAFGAEAAGTPRVALVHLPYLFPAPGLPPPGFGLQPGRRALGRLRDDAAHAVAPLALRPGLHRLNRVRSDLGLDPHSGFFDFLNEAARVVVLTSASYDFQARRLPDNVRYVGPVLEAAGINDSGSAAAAGARGAGDPPLVLVSLSSTYMAQEEVLRSAIEALGRLPVRGLVTTGSSVDPNAFDPPPNVEVVSYRSHSEVLPAVSLVVTHAGHGTVIAALSHGVPLVCVPMGRDQHDNAARVVASGAGVRVKRRDPDALTSAMTRVLGDDRYRAAAERMAGTLRSEPGARGAVDEIERVAAESA